VPDDVTLPRPDTDEPVWRRGLVAELGGRAVGAASLVRTPLTDAYFADVSVTEGQRRRGIGTQLARALQATADSSIPILARAMASQPVRRQFAEALGCTVVVHCPEPWIDPTTADVQRWIAHQAPGDGYAVVPMSDVSVDAVFRAFATYFVWAHAPFGVVHREALPAYWEACSAGMDPNLSRLCLDRDGDIVAFSLVTPDAWQGRSMIVSETVQVDQADGDALLAATVAGSLEALAERGIRLVELEGHTTDPHSPALVASLPTIGADPMDMVRLDLPGA